MAARLETRGRRPKILEPPKEPARSQTHWDHVLKEMVWLAKDFESERKWKLANAKRVALRVSKSGLDQASRGEKRLKEEEQRTRRLASNIAKDVRKFWMKIEKLVLYKHQVETEERKKRERDKQLDFLLGQTERYSTMLAENLVDLPSSHERKSQLLLQSCPVKPGNEASDHQDKNDRLSSKDPSGPPSCSPSQIHISDEEAHSKILDKGSHLNIEESEDDFSMATADDMEDDEATLEADEALITEDERREELAALKNECDIPIEELLKRYRHNKGSKSAGNDSEDNVESNEQDDEENLTLSEEEKSHLNFGVESIDADTNRDSDFKPTVTSDLQDTKLDTGDELHKNEGLGDGDGLYTAFVHGTDSGQEVDPLAQGELSDGRLSLEQRTTGEEMAASSDSGNEMDDGEYINATVTGEEEDDEVTLLEEEELARVEGNDTTREIEFLKAESELPIEELLARYKQMECSDEENAEEP